MTERRLLILPGDGIGPEVAAVARRVAEACVARGWARLSITEAPFGGAAIDAVPGRAGVPLPDAVRDAAIAADAVLMGAVGGPAWADVPYDRRPEAGLLALRSAMRVYANLRPATARPALAAASPLKDALVGGVDMLFVRELTGGVYFGEPRGITGDAAGERTGVNTHRYTATEIRRVAHVAFAEARARGQALCSVDKANVMEAGRLWREEVTAVGAADYPDVPLDHMLADNAAMQLVRAPRSFGVIVTDNLFGDILSDLAAVLTGSIGMLPSAAIGDPGMPGLFEPIHGSAPDISGQGIANPAACVLSLAMAFDRGLGAPQAARRVERAVDRVIDAGIRTPDLGGTHGTAAMADAIIAALDD